MVTLNEPWNLIACFVLRWISLNITFVSTEFWNSSHTQVERGCYGLFSFWKFSAYYSNYVYMINQINRSICLLPVSSYPSQSIIWWGIAKKIRQRKVSLGWALHTGRSCYALTFCLLTYFNRGHKAWRRELIAKHTVVLFNRSCVNAMHCWRISIELNASLENKIFFTYNVYMIN